MTGSVSSRAVANVAVAPSPIDEAYLEDRLAALEAARTWSLRAVSRLEALIRSPDESGLFRVNKSGARAQYRRRRSNRPVSACYGHWHLHHGLDSALPVVFLNYREFRESSKNQRQPLS